jgi:hypothetical protein
MEKIKKREEEFSSESYIEPIEDENAIEVVSDEADEINTEELLANNHEDQQTQTNIGTKNTDVEKNHKNEK